MPPHLFSPEELREIGFAQLGRGVRIDRSVRFFGAGRISIGDETRIDCFCILSAGGAGISIGRNVHLAPFTAVTGQAAVAIEDFANVSHRCAIFTSSDDYTGGAMTNPTIPAAFTAVTHGPVRIGRHAIIGAGSVVLPGVTIGLGGAVGALSVLRRDVPDFAIVAGNPARQLGERGRRLLDLEREFLASQGAGGPGVTPAASPPP